MSVAKGISRIGHVFGKVAGIALGIVTAILFIEYILEHSKSMNFDFNGSIRSAFVFFRSSLILLGSPICGFLFGYLLGYLPFVWIARTLNWVIEGFRER